MIMGKLTVLVWFKCLAGYEPLPPPRPAAIAAPVWQDRTIASAKLRLLEYSAFMEIQRDREMVKTPRHSCNATSYIYIHAFMCVFYYPFFPTV